VPTEDSFMNEVGPQGALCVGSPENVAQKIARNLTVLGANRFDLKYGMGGLSHQALMTNIEEEERLCSPEGVAHKGRADRPCRVEAGARERAREASTRLAAGRCPT
jgi:hypothetical protein